MELELKEIQANLHKVNKMLTQAQALARIGSWEMDICGGKIYISDETRKICGIQTEENCFRYEEFLKLVHQDDVSAIENMVNNPEEGHISLEFRLIKPDGSIRNFSGLAEFLFNENGNPTHIIGTIQDITEKKQLEDELQQQQQKMDSMAKRFQALIRESTDVFEILAPDGTILYISDACEQVIGYKPEERIGKKVYEFYSGAELSKVKRMMKRILEHPKEKLQETVLIRAKDGRPVYIEVIKQNLMHEPSIQGIVVNFRDISQRILMEREILYLSTHDEVTGLPNRLYFNQELKSYMHSDEGCFGPAIVMIEIDRYKYISEVLGYQLGDELLIRIAEKLRAILGNETFISRYSAARLAVIVPDFYDKEELAGRIRNVIELTGNTFRVNSYGLEIGMNIGISIYQGGNQQPDIIVQQAEMALYLAKNEGKNQYRFYSTEIDINNYKHFELRNDLKRSIENNQLQVHFQPIVSLQTNEIVAAEALIRWLHPNWGMVPPAEFISIAEETGFIIEIGGWVLREVCRFYKQWLDRGLPAIKVSVNFSGIQFFEANFVEKIIQTIYEFGLDPGFLVMEITESILLDNKEKARMEIKRLQAAGIQIALDDFGTGFSSLAYLHSFDIDIIKIDGAFIKNSLVDAASDVIIRSIINMAQELKIGLIAEGIETYDQLKYLQKLNCNAGQGYLFSGPLPVYIFEQVLSGKVCHPIPLSDEKPGVKEERRKFVRINFPFLPEADMTILKLNNRRVNIGNTRVLVKNISPEGLSFLSNIRMPVDQEVLLQFEAQFAGVQLKVTGCAVWISILDSGLYEYWVKFALNDKEQLELIAILNQIEEGIKGEALVAEDIPAADIQQYQKRRVTEVIYHGKY